MQAHFKLDTSLLDKGLQAAARVTKRCASELVNTAAYWIAVNAKNKTPFVTPQKIDSEMGTIVTPLKGIRGKVLSQKYAKNKVYSSGLTLKVKDKKGREKEVPRAALIVAARANPNSRYNQLTNHRYAISKNPFKGFNRSLGRQKMTALVDRLIKSRHSSSKFLRAGWIPAILAIKPFAVRKYTRGAGPPDTDLKSKIPPDIGSGMPAKEGAWKVVSTIENAVGMRGKNKLSHNQALAKYGVKPLQDAIDHEGRKNMEYAMKKMGEDIEKSV